MALINMYIVNKSESELSERPFLNDRSKKWALLILCSAKKNPLQSWRVGYVKFVTSQETVTDMGRTGSTAAE